MIIEVDNLKKVYRTNIKEPGFKGSIKNLVHSKWDEKIAIDTISFAMKEGQALACIGENGAGKSTLIKLLIGILQPTSGNVSVYGQNPSIHPKSYLRKIGVMFGQKSNLWTDIPVIESYRAMKTFYNVEAKEFNDNLKIVTDLLTLKPILYSPARKLSLGQRMKADIGLIFLHSPNLLFLDEPTIGLDINTKYIIRKFICRMNREKGVSVFLTSHDLDDIDEICSDAIVLSKGKIFYHGTLNELKQKYAKNKIVTIIGKQQIDITGKLSNAIIETYKGNTKITYDSTQCSSAQIINIISNAFEIEDITIQEPSIDYIVSKIFSKEANI